MLERFFFSSCGQDEVDDMGVLRRTSIDRCVYTTALAHGRVTAMRWQESYCNFNFNFNFYLNFHLADV